MESFLDSLKAILHGFNTSVDRENRYGEEGFPEKFGRNIRAMGSWFWWIKILVVGIFSAFLLIFGVEVLIGAYGLKQPQAFIMYFFSGSFIILFSLVGIIYPVMQIYTFFSQRPPLPEDDS